MRMQIAVKKIIDFMRTIEEDFKIHIDYLDFGGGFPSSNRFERYLFTP